MLPNDAELDAVVQLITGDTRATFEGIRGPEARMDIIRIAQASTVADAISDLREVVDILDTTMQPIREWFQKSKLYEP